MTKLPEEIQVSRHIYYDVQELVKTIVDMDSDKNPDDVTLEEVVELVLDYAYDDFATLTDFEPIVTDLEGNLLN